MCVGIYKISICLWLCVCVYSNKNRSSFSFLSQQVSMTRWWVAGEGGGRRRAQWKTSFVSQNLDQGTGWAVTACSAWAGQVWWIIASLCGACLSICKSEDSLKCFLWTSWFLFVVCRYVQDKTWIWIYPECRTHIDSIWDFWVLTGMAVSTL